MSISRDNALTWNTPVVIGAPNVKAYLPILVHDPKKRGHAALAYYGSSDNHHTWHAYIAETADVLSPSPKWTSIIGNPSHAPLQANNNKAFDSGYWAALYDLIENVDIKFDQNGDLVAAFARKMCTARSLYPRHFSRSTCVEGWDYDAHGKAAWQGVVLFAKH